MAQRAGTANLPLHGGQVPKWLADRMTRLGAVIGEAVVHHYGRDELLRRLAHPFWFQSFGAVMGMDWHSSGITTSVIGALKRGLTRLERELGIHVCGGRGKYSRQTPQELVDLGDRLGFDGTALATASRLVAKVDSAAVQDGFQLYLHGFIVTDDGHWVVVQQGMNGELKQARRYHWLSEGLKSFVDEPHAAIEALLLLPQYLESRIFAGRFPRSCLRSHSHCHLDGSRNELCGADGFEKLWRREAQFRFARDSPLEEAVLSELVSEAKFPGNWEKYRDFYRRDLRVRLLARNP